MTTKPSKAERHCQQLQDLLPPGGIVHAYVTGRGHLRWSLRLTVIVCLGVLVWDLALALGYILVPGGLLAFVIWRELRPHRGVALTTSGLVVAACSFWSGRPNVILVAAVPVETTSVQQGNRTTLHVGPERVSLPTYAWRQLGLDLPPPPWFPPPPGTTATPTAA